MNTCHLSLALAACLVALFSPYPGSRGPKSILAESLDGVDRKLLYPAVQSLLQNEDSVARASVGKVFDELTDRDLVELLPAITKAIEYLAPSNEMFGDGIRLAGLDLLSRLHIREGLTLCVSVMEPGRWGAGNRVGPCLKYLQRYGSHAETVLPQLREIRAQTQQVEQIDQCIAAIESSTDMPVLVDIAEFKTRHLAK
jgi:hypothetical protein